MLRILLIFFLFPVLTYAYQVAYIKESRALIYSDHTLKIPIGYLSKGKKVKVGEVKRNNGTTLPLVLSGKVVYIKVSDLSLKDESPDVYQQGLTDHFIEGDDDNKEYLEPVRLVLNLGFMEPGSQWDDLMSLTGGDKKTMLQIEALLELRLIESKFFFDLGFIFSTLSGGNYTFTGLGLKGLVQYDLLKSELLALDLKAGFHFAPGGAKVSYNGIYDNGSYYGWVVGGQARIFPGSFWNLNLGIDYNILGLHDISNIQLSSGEFDLNILEGFTIYFGVSFPI